jgi:ATP-binding cassette subfamily G (WHITE) protein 2 (SNQ2)
MLFEAREGPSKMFHWLPFVVGEIIGELPYMIISGALFYVIWSVRPALFEPRPFC